MTDLLKEIIDVDKAARERVAAAQHERSEAYLSASSQKEKLIRDAKENARKAAEEQSRENRAAGETALQAIRERNRAIIEKMDALCAENKERWIDCVVQGVLSEV